MKAAWRCTRQSQGCTAAPTLDRGGQDASCLQSCANSHNDVWLQVEGDLGHKRGPAAPEVLAPRRSPLPGDWQEVSHHSAVCKQAQVAGALPASTLLCAIKPDLMGRCQPSPRCVLLMGRCQPSLCCVQASPT